MNEDQASPPGKISGPIAGKRRVVLIVIVVVLAAAALAARPAYHRLVRWRSRQFAAQAGLLLDRGNWTAANDKARAAYLLDPAGVPAIHALAQVLTQATNAEALPLWRQLVAAGRTTPADRRDFIALALHTGAVSYAADELPRLFAVEMNQPVDDWLASQLSTALQDEPHALYYATRAWQLDPTNAQYQLFVSSLLYDARDAGQRAMARNNVWTAARGSDSLALDALDFLAARSDLTAGQMSDLLGLLQRQPPGGGREWQILDLQIRLAPGRRGEILDAAVARYQSAPPETFRQFCLWLNQHGEYQRTLTVLPQAAAMQNKDLFLVYLDTLAYGQQWNEIKQLLDTGRVPLEDVYQEAFQARCAAELGNPQGAASHWHWAVTDAGRNPQQLVWVADYAGQLQEWETASNALRELTICLREPRAAYAQLEQLVERNGSTADLRDLVGEMLHRWPNDPALRNDHAYLDALLGQNLPAARSTAAELVQQYPKILTHRTTLALACYRLGDFPAALAAYDGQAFDWSQAQPEQRAVHAAVLAANGQEDAAREEAQGIPTAGLRPEERELVSHPK